MQVVTSELAYIHTSRGSTLWNSDDQELLNILFLSELNGLNDVDMHDAIASSAPQIQRGELPALPVTALPHKKIDEDKKTLLDRRVRHREVVKRAYHRNKAALKSLRETVRELEDQFEKLAESKLQSDSAAFTSETMDLIQRRIALLASEQEDLSNEAIRLRQLLECRQQFASSMATLIEGGTSLSIDSDHFNTISDSTTPSSTTSPSSQVVDSDAQIPYENDCFAFKATQKTKTPFYNQPCPTFINPTISKMTPLAMNMREELGYKPLNLSDSSMLVTEIYRSILSFTLNGTAISTGASIMGWEDKRLLDGTSLKFSLRKQFTGHNALHFMTLTWQCLSDPKCTETKFRGLMTLRVLQRISDDAIVALRETYSEDDTKLYRCVYLLFRVRTRLGFLICVQSVAPERLTDLALSCSSRDGRIVQWTDLSGWFRFEPAIDGKNNSDLFYEDRTQVEYGGCMDHGDHESVATLAMNTLSIVFKWESMMVGPSFYLPPPSS